MNFQWKDSALSWKNPPAGIIFKQFSVFMPGAGSIGSRGCIVDKNSYV
jgi:hypothetical protein